MKDILIKAVGDICPGDKYIMGLGVLNKTEKYGVDFSFNGTRKHLKKADIVLGNFEGLLTKKIKNDNSNLTFCGLPEFSNAMTRSGINVLNVANNHILEHGSEVFFETLTILEDAGINICGLRSEDDSFYSKPVIININNKKFGIIGYNWVGIDKFENTDTFIAQSRDSVVNYTWIRKNNRKIALEKSNKNVVSDIKKLKKSVDYVILMAHWGYEFVIYPPSGVVKEARLFIDSGADIIIGGHPHVIQGMEQYRNGLICYSMGNFIFDRRNILPQYTMVMNLKINESVTFDYTPYYINNVFKPIKANSKQKNIIDKIISESNGYLKGLEGDDFNNDDEIYQEYEKSYIRYKRETILHHFLAIFEKPSISILILKKGINLLKLMHDRIKGNKTRW